MPMESDYTIIIIIIQRRHMINVLVNHIRCKMIIKKKKKRLIKVNTKDGKVLYLVEPGYFFNEDVFLIYSQIEDEIEYEDLKSWMMSHYF